MIRVIKNMIRSTVSGLTVYRQPSYLAAGVAAGLLVGLLPKDSLLPWALATVFMFTRVNFLVMLATAAVCTIAAPYGDWLTHQVGSWILDSSQLASVFQRTMQLPIVPWLRLNNSVTLGTLVLCIPVSFLGYRFSRQAFIGYFRFWETRRLTKLRVATDDYRKEIRKQKTRRDGVAFEAPATIAASVGSKTTTTPDGNVEKRFDTAASIDEVKPNVTPNADSPDHASQDQTAGQEINGVSPDNQLDGAGLDEQVTAHLQRVEQKNRQRNYHLGPSDLEGLESDSEEAIELVNGNVIVDPLTGQISRIDAAPDSNQDRLAAHGALLDGPRQPTTAAGGSREGRDDTEDILAAIADDVMSIAADASRARQIISEDNSLANPKAIDQIDRDILAIHQALDSADRDTSSIRTVVDYSDLPSEPSNDRSQPTQPTPDSVSTKAKLKQIEIVRMPEQYSDAPPHSSANERPSGSKQDSGNAGGQAMPPNQNLSVSDGSDEPNGVIPPHESLQFLLRHLHRGEK